MKLSSVSIDRPVFTTMATLAVLVLGGLGLSRLGVDLFPDISFPIVAVTVPYPGADPEEVERQVTRPLEEAVSSINGVEEVRSYSRSGAAVLIVKFDLEADVRQASSDVRDRIAVIRGTLPPETLDPTIQRFDPSAIPVVTYAVSSPKGARATRRLVDDVLRPALEQVDGVGSVIVHGGEVREIQVDVDLARLEQLGLPLARVAQAIGDESHDLPAGRLQDGAREISLKAVARFARPDEVGEVVLAARPDGTQLRVKDVARIVDGVREVRTLTRVNGVSAITVDVQKRGGENTVAVVDRVEAALVGLRARLGGGVEVKKVIDSSLFVRINLVELRAALLWGGLFAVLVIFVFLLDWRSTLISALALPTSIIATFFVMWLFGFSLNMMTMTGLSLSIGLLIDDSVVVRENIYRRMELGEDRVTAARLGTAEIALAVMATTFTIVAVFGPVAFTGGLVGQFFREFGITVAAAVLMSLLVSFTLDPMLSARVARQLPPGHKEAQLRRPIVGAIVRAYDSLDVGYRGLLAWALSHRKTVGAGALLIFAGSMFLPSLMGKEFQSRGDRGEFSVGLELAAGASLAETDRVTAQVEAILRADPDVIELVAVVGDDEEANSSALRVKTTPKTARDRSVAQIQETLRPKLAAIPGLTFKMREAGIAGASSVEEAPITISVRGADYAELGRVAERALEVVRGTQGVRDPSSTWRPGQSQRHLSIDRVAAADLGVSWLSVAGTLRLAIEGERVAKFHDEGEDIDVRVRLGGGNRLPADALGALPVPSRMGRTAYLRDVTQVGEGSTTATIERLNRERQITITANIVGRSLGDVVTDIQARLKAVPRPAGYTFTFGGEAERMRETFANLGLALALSIVFIYFVLASQFESFLHPLTIMLSLPLAIVGALAALFLTGGAIGMPAMIGIILLMGLVTKNAILLVDRANQLRGDGAGVIDALLAAGATRLRPILMTSAAMVLGMLPTAISQGEGSEFRSPMSIAVIGGVITSTGLTLIVVPVVYVWIDRFTVRGRRERRTARAEARTAV
ncbi:MAG: efflux RND transporter permease subunit [Myxococcales bacterium]|nr:efflux RND transporter permease subunit [Myxococcales bacterium]